MSRRLAKTQRVVGERHAARAEAARSSVVKSMERLYVSALKEGRVIDADFYKKSLKSMYPDWEFKGDEPKGEKATDAKSSGEEKSK